MPAPPARNRSLKVPCGFNSTCNSPLRTSCSNNLFSPTYVEIIFLTWRCWSSTPIPKSSTPALLLTIVRSFAPLRRTAAMRFSGIPQSPKPPMSIVAPSRSFSIPTSAEAMRLSIPCSELFGAVYCIQRRRVKVSRLQAAQELVEFVGGVEVAFELATAQLFTKFVKAPGEEIECSGKYFLIRQNNIAPCGIGTARQPQRVAQPRAG